MKTQWIDPLPVEIESIPSQWMDPVLEQGQIKELYYETWESDQYAMKTIPLTKRAMVYVPYGMNASTPLDVVFLMHGGWSDETTILGTPDHPSELKLALDHLLEAKKMKPLLVVCPTYNNLHPKDSWDYSLAIRLTSQYPQELINDLLPTVVKTYPTFAQSTDDASLRQARDHFSFGGFSMGSVCTWRVFEQSLAYFHTFIPMSGNSGTSGSQLAQIVRRQGFGPNDFFLLGLTGSRDFAAQGFVRQLQSLVNESSMFSYTQDGLDGNLALRIKEGYEHDHQAMETYFLYALKWLGQADQIKDPGLFTAKTSISEVLHDPAFLGFAQLLFPIQRSYMQGETLGEIDLTWYSNIHSETTIEVLNILKEQVLDGQKVFYSIYSEQEMEQDPTKRNTGLIFFRGLPNAPFAIVNAGGGFMYVAAIHDSFPAALEISRMGLNGFALIYRPGAQTACQDLARAIAFIFEHQNELQIDVNGYSIWGGSAGGRMAAWVSELGTAAFGEPDLPKPAADVIQYTGLSEVSPQDVATYMIVGDHDGIAWYRTMEARSQALRDLGIESICRVVPGLSHGFGLGLGTQAEGWVQEAVNFWLEQRQKKSSHSDQY